MSHKKNPFKCVELIFSEKKKPQERKQVLTHPIQQATDSGSFWNMADDRGQFLSHQSRPTHQ